MRIALLADDRQLMLEALLNGGRERAIPPGGAGIGLHFQQREGVAVGQLPEGGEDRVLEVPVGLARLGNAARVGQGMGNVGEVPLQRRQRHEPMARRATGFGREASRRRIERNDAQEAMEGKLTRVDEMRAGRGGRGKAGPSAEGQGLMHHGARRQLYIEVLAATLFPGGQCRGIVGEDDQAIAMSGHSGDQIEGGVAMTRREQAAEIGIALGGLDQEHRTVVIVRELSPQDRP